MAAPGQVIALLLAGQRVLRQFQELIVCGQRQPACGDFRDQADLRAAPCFGQRQIVFKCFVLKVFYATENVQLVAAQTKLCAVLVTG